MKALPIVLIVVCFAAIVTTVLVIRSKRRDELPQMAIPTVAAPVAAPVTQPPPPPVASSPEPTPKLVYDYRRPVGAPPNAPQAESDQAAEVVRVRTLLQIYRRSVYDNSITGMKLGLKALKKVKELALRLAREDLERAKSDEERKSIQGAIDDIERD